MSFLVQANEWRRRGARVQTVAFVLSERPEASILLVEPAVGHALMPPQEGVHVGETAEEAFFRCLEEECGIVASREDGMRQAHVDLRLTAYLDTLELPPDRRGHRSVADGPLDASLASVYLTMKAYWAVVGTVRSVSQVIPIADGREVRSAGWYPLDVAAELIRRTNRPEKAVMLLKGLRQARAVLSCPTPPS